MNKEKPKNKAQAATRAALSAHSPSPMLAMHPDGGVPASRRALHKGNRGI